MAKKIKYLSLLQTAHVGIIGLLIALSIAFPSAALANFELPVTYKLDVETPNSQLALADFNNDGANDMAISGAINGVSFTGSRINFFMGKNSGKLKVEYEIKLANLGITAMDTGDFNGDDITDLIVATYKTDGQYDEYCGTTGGVIIFLGDIFEELPIFRLGGCIDSLSDTLEVIDANADGFDDILAGNTLFVSQGDGTFSTDYIFPTSSQLQAADLDGDGFTDVFSLAGEFFCGDGHGEFSDCGPFAINSSGLSLDMNADNISDSITAAITGYTTGTYNVVFQSARRIGGAGFYSSGKLGQRVSKRLRLSNYKVRSISWTVTRTRDVPDTSAISIKLNHADGSNEHILGPDITGIFSNVYVADINGDGIRDAIGSIQWKGDELVVFHGNGDGTLGEPIIIDTPGRQGKEVFFDDWNGDNSTDIAWLTVPADSESLINIMFQIPPETTTDPAATDPNATDPTTYNRPNNNYCWHNADKH